MSWDPSVLHSIWTVIALCAFLLIIGWAWGRGRRDKFERAARIPLEEGPDAEHIAPLGESR